jgi:hypothetical protein
MSKLDAHKPTFPATLEIADKDDNIDITHQHQQAQQQHAAFHRVLLQQQKEDSNLNLASPYNVPPVKMESESSVAAPPLGITSKLDANNVFQAFHSFSQPPLAPFNNSYQSTPYQGIHFQSPNDLFESSKNMPMNTQRSNIDNATLQSLQSRLIENNNKLANASQDKISLTQSSSNMSSGSVPVNGSGTSTNHQSFAYDERFHALYEREIRWSEVYLFAR